MKFSFPMPGGGSGVALFSKLVRTKDLRQMQSEDVRSAKPKLTKCLTTLDLTSLGVGSCCGTGMYLVAGMVARNVAGPGVVLSFMIAALASIFSGACYAEFGVRVPHTSGSAYMYSYVTVGEFVAFIIGWNMILEYLIGTSACACALSASFDSLAGGAITRRIADTITVFGHAPDLIAFSITLVMTCVMALGASKSVIFNNTLNAINLATWVFIMAAGLFYVDTDTWHDHQGFLPFGWSGVFTGAATCFYAFIGFDIIATTGEEAHNPQKSIPKAIVGSLVIVLIAYVTSSLVLTLVVPFDHIDPGSALIQMWTYVGATKCRAVVVVGATAGLSVAMFGSMFPMPRVIYAMAQDGLIFRPLAQLCTRTNAPGLATLLSGVAAALVSMFVSLEVLVEMMSIGTLLAYTLVSTCVLVLRYQPHSMSLVELLPAQLRTPQPASTPSNPMQLGGEVLLTTATPATTTTQTSTLTVGPVGKHKHVTVRKVTRGSPDSDDSFADDSPEGYLGGRDDQFLVSDRNENKFYGSVHGAPTGNPSTLDGIGLGVVGRKIEEYAYLCPGLYPWVNPGPATTESGMYVTKLVGVMFVLIFVLDLMAAIGVSGTFAGLIITGVVIGILGILLVISRQPQNRYALAFLTPALPFVPTVAITVNIYLIFKLSILTLVRFTIWMTLGLIMYFYYGITHSTLENPSEEIELTVDQSSAAQRPAAGSTQQQQQPQSAVWDRHGYENKMADDDWSQSQFTGSSWSNARNAPTGAAAAAAGSTQAWGSATNTTTSTSTKGGQPSAAPAQAGPVPGGFGIFVDESQFPTWDD